MECNFAVFSKLRTQNWQLKTMISLSTQIPQLLFSSAIPDLAINTDGDGEVEIALTSAGNTVFTASHFPYNRQIKVYDLRSVVEYYMRSQGSSLMDFAITADDGSGVRQLCSFKVIYLEHRFDGDITVFLRNNFLTNTSSKMTSQKALEKLTVYLEAGQSERVRYEIVTQREDEPAQLTVATEDIGGYTDARLVDISLSCEVIREMGSIDPAARLLAFSVHVGARAFTYYVSPSEPQLRMFFRNAFNVWECCELFAVTTQIAESERSIAVTNRISTFYNQRNEKKYEVESAGLTYEQAQWIEQLFYSHDVRMGEFDDELEPWDVELADLPRVLITDFTCEISDKDGELNTVKFTYQFADRRTWLQTDYLTVDHDRVFTEQYDPTFN